MSIDITRALATSDYDCEERRAELTWLAEQASTRKTICEIGVWKGTTTIAMAANTSGSVYAVDTFEGSVGEEQHQKLHEKPKDWLFNEFKHNTKGLENIITYQMTSLEAAKLFGDAGKLADLIFLDASHNYESVVEDIVAWRPLLAEGGLLCGHDRQWEGVAKAIDQLLPGHKVAVGAIWYI
jgi:predicted O-methyltransferase YrrM